MRLRNKIPEIFSRIEKFRKIQEPILAELGIKEALAEVNQVLDHALSLNSDAGSRLEKIQNQLRGIIPDINKVENLYEQASDGANLVIGDLRSAGLTDNSMLNDAEDVLVEIGMGSMELEKIRAAIKKTT